MNLIKNIPNLFTLGNLSLGVMGIFLLLTKPEEYATTIPYMVLGAGILDFLDGFLAKALKAQSPIGAQLDSLADLITFGVLPGFIYWHYTQTIEWNWVLLLIPICSAWRLAKFNVSTDQTDSFKGISTTAHGLFACTLPMLMLSQNNGVNQYISEPYVLIGLGIFFSFLMVSNLRMISLKFKSLSFKENITRYILLIGSLVLMTTLGWSSSPFIMALYLALSLFAHYNVK